jgi:hypothetical protein
LAVVALSACSFHTQQQGTDASDHPRDGTTTEPDGPVIPPDACSDKDQDGICDVVDAWPCGATQPSDPNNIILLHSQNSNVTGADFGGSGSSKVKVSTPGQSWPFHYAWGLQVGCPNGSNSCRAQIEFGIAGVGRLGCLVDGTVQDNQFVFSLSDNATAMMPTMPGVYEMRAKIGLTSGGCGMTSNWFGGSEPDSSTTFAILCVPP